MSILFKINVTRIVLITPYLVHKNLFSLFPIISFELRK